MQGPESCDRDEDGPDDDLSPPGNAIRILIGPDHAGQRLDKALADLAPDLSRARIARLIADGAVTGPDGHRVSSLRNKTRAGEAYAITVPPPEPAEPAPEPIPLTVLHEDADLIVLNKPAGMVVHPAPGAPSGTLVNALLHHCGDSLAGIGGTARPGIVHRIDKDTSGLLVVAKTEPAHHGLARQFADHSAERRYLAITRGAPDTGDPRLRGLRGVSVEATTLRIETGIARHRTDRKRMAVAWDATARNAITRMTTEETFGTGARPTAALISCRLQTGRTHQIRVHARYLGHPLAGDPVYGRPDPIARDALPPETAQALQSFPRQALHAADLGFVHPVTGENLRFTSEPPGDFRSLLEKLRRNPFTNR